MNQLDDKTFGPTLEGAVELGSPMFVMFAADWAGPCHLAFPSFQSVANRFGNQIIFATFDLDENHKVPSSFNVRAVPCFVMLKDGGMSRMIAGHVGEEILVEACEDALE